MEAVLEKVTEENQKLKRDLNWAEVFIIGKIYDIKSINGLAKKIYIQDHQRNIHHVQAWDYAYTQMLKNEFQVGDYVGCFAWPSYYDNGKKVSLKTNCIFEAGTVWKMIGTINSEWLKTTSKGKDVWQFTVKDGNKNGRIIHCTVPKDSILMREIQKSKQVEIIGYPTFNYEDDTLRINLEVVYISEVRNEINY